MSQPTPKPVQKDGEENLAYNLRVTAWRRAERARKRKAENPPKEAAKAAPEETREDSVRDAWSRSERELEEMGE